MLMKTNMPDISDVENSRIRKIELKKGKGKMIFSVFMVVFFELG
jgi:hypothetical protein